MVPPVALAIAFFYSFTKRFTSFSHLVLGFSLGIAPAAAWIAVRGELDPRILWLTAAVGSAAGMGRETSAVLGTVLALIVLSLLPRIRPHANTEE